MTDNKTNTTLFELQKNLEDLVSAKMQMEEFRTASTNVVQGIGSVQQNFVKHLSAIEADYKERVNRLEQGLSSFLESNKKENINTLQEVVSSTDKTISKGVEQFSHVADKVDSSNDKNVTVITKLLEHYKKVVEASSSLADSLTAIDFPTKLDAISSKTQLVIESTNNAKQALELKLMENNTSITEKTAEAKIQINQNTDTKFQSLSEQLINTKENLSKTVSEKSNEQAIATNANFENLNKTLQDNFTQINLRQNQQDHELKTLKIISFVICGLIVIGTMALILLK